MLYKIFKLGDVFKVVFFKTNPGAKSDDYLLDDEKEQNTEKLDNNLCRAKTRVRELALCNDWSHWCTITLNKNKMNRYDLDGYIKKLGEWISHYNRKYNTKLKYILIPEQHEDGAWHMHGLMNGLSPDSLIKNKHGYLDMPFYAERFGWISLDPVKDKLRISSYISKYISKDVMKATEIKLHKHSFYASRGLKGAELVHEDFTACIPSDVWTNDYVGIQMCDSYEDLQAFIKKMETNNENITSD